jgi:hypothetical protein
VALRNWRIRSLVVAVGSGPGLFGAGGCSKSCPAVGAAGTIRLDEVELNSAYGRVSSLDDIAPGLQTQKACQVRVSVSDGKCRVEVRCLTATLMDGPQNCVVSDDQILLVPDSDYAYMDPPQLYLLQDEYLFYGLQGDFRGRADMRVVRSCNGQSGEGGQGGQNGAGGLSQGGGGARGSGLSATATRTSTGTGVAGGTNTGTRTGTGTGTGTGKGTGGTTTTTGGRAATGTATATNTGRGTNTNTSTGTGVGGSGAGAGGRPQGGAAGSGGK